MTDADAIPQAADAKPRFWTRTDLYGDGRDPRHVQEGSVLIGVTRDGAKPTGISWQWCQWRDGRQTKRWHFDGADHESFDTARAAWQAKHEACGTETAGQVP